MHKRIFLMKICVVVLVALGCNILKGDGNLLSNPSFETAGSGSYAEDWNTYHCGYTRSSDQSKEGSWSCKIVGTGSANEIGLGGCANLVSSGLPSKEKFTVSSNIYIFSYIQGIIYGAYVTVNYTDSSQDIFDLELSSSEIAANINTWKKYSRTFTTNPGKTISSITMWSLVWTDNGNKFIGTVYFDDLKLEVFKPVIYSRGENICNANDPDQAAADVLNRGFTHVSVNQYAGISGNYEIFLSSKGFKVIKNIARTPWNMTFTPRYFSPYNDKQNYDDTKQTLTDFLNDFPQVSGIMDDIEELPFPSIRYSADGVAAEYTFSDLACRIGNQTSQSSGWPVFKDWPTSGDHDVSNLTMENIEYNFPELAVDISGTPSGAAFIGYYGPGYTYDSYEMAAQTFKLPAGTSRISRIDVMLRRRGSNTEFPNGDLYYYLTEVDANGKPDLTRKISYGYCTIYKKEVDYSDSNWDNIVPLPLYFDPVAVGFLDSSKKYAVVIEFTKKDNYDWNNAYYYIAGFNSDVYSDGKAFLRRYGSWVDSTDLWLKVYRPNPPTGFDLNQFHEDWIDFQGAVVARYAEDYRNIADSVTPAREVWIYSGYTGVGYPKNTHNYDGTTRRAYTANWEMLSAADIDYAICGYGVPSITATVDALEEGNPSNPPKIVGGGIYPGMEYMFIDRYNNCDGGMLFYSGSYVDDPGWSVP